MAETTRILLVGPYPPPYGGVSVHLRRLTELLEAPQWDVRILTTAGHGTTDARVTSVRSRRALTSSVRQAGQTADVVHDHTEFYQGRSLPFTWWFGSVLRRSGRPVVLTIHDGTFPDRWRRMSGVRQRAVQALLRSYDVVVVVSETLRLFVQDLGVAPHRCHVIRAYLPLSEPVPALDPALEQRLPSRTRNILMIGAMHDVYHPDVVVDAFERIATIDAEVGLVIVAGSFVSDQSPVIGRLPAHIRHRVSVVKDLSPGMTQALIRRSSVLIRSAWPDGDGISMREALMLGTPVVATETGERPAVVRTYSHADAGALSNAIMEALKEGRKETAASEVREEAIRNLERLKGLYREAAGRSPRVSQ